MTIYRPIPLEARQGARSPDRRRRAAVKPALSACLPDDCLDCPSRRWGFCQALPKGLLGRLSAMASPVVQRPNHWFWDEESAPRFVAIVRSGYLRLLSYSRDGARQISGIAGPGAIVGEASPGRSGYGLESSTRVSLCAFDPDAFARLQGGSVRFRRAVYAEQNCRLDALRRHIWSRGLQTPEERLCAFVVRACDALPFEPLPQGGVLTLDIPRGDIADLLGTSRETISRLCHQWQERGWIEIRDPRHFVIRDRAALALKGGLAVADAADDAAHAMPSHGAERHRGTRAGVEPRACAPPLLPSAPRNHPRLRYF